MAMINCSCLDRRRFHRRQFDRRQFLGLAALFAATTALVLPVTSLPAHAAEDEATWASLKPDVFGSRTIEDGAGVIKLDAPYRAEDAAIVPIGFEAGLADGRTIKAVTVIVDENPSPVVATFRFGEGRKTVGLSTRVRVNSYSYVRAVAEASDGKLYMTKAFVKASGGCSAPAGKDPEEAAANVGKMRMATFDKDGRREAQVQLRHPNNSGLQSDPVTHLFIPAWFVRDLEVRQGDKTVMSMQGGISISEDPTIRFTVAPGGAGPYEVEAIDTENREFKGTFEPKPAS
jgi:sulfur-oxidizing protein SoxY